MLHEKLVTIHETDAVADEIIRLVCDLWRQGSRDAGYVRDVTLAVVYQEGALRSTHQHGGGYWLASVTVKPARKRRRHASANGSSPNGAVQNLLKLVQDLPPVAWG